LAAPRNAPIALLGVTEWYLVDISGVVILNIMSEWYFLSCFICTAWIRIERVRRTTSEPPRRSTIGAPGSVAPSIINLISLISKQLLRGLLPAVVTLFATALWVCAGDTISVAMFDKPACFRPQHLTVRVGATIKWINSGETVHTVTADPEQAPDPSWVQMPPGSEVMDSGYMNVGDSYTYEFKVPGVYKYFCLTHEQEGMRGEVDVEK
jgi:plastocyanin